MSYDKPRINLMDSGIDILMKMSGGNPGALRVCMDILQRNSGIDPDDAMGGIGPLLSLDVHDIYESQIWILYKDVCGENLESMLAFMRAVQLGYATESELKNAVRNESIQSDRLNELIAAVRKHLPHFGISQEAQAA
jgi:hypothetical protein